MKNKNNCIPSAEMRVKCVCNYAITWTQHDLYILGFMQSGILYRIFWSLISV